MVVPALPVLERDLHASASWATWTVSIYLLSASVATPLLGRLGDQIGKGRVLVVVLAVFVIGCLGAMLAWNIWSLIVFRAVQGVAGASYPLAFSIIRDELPTHRVSVGMGLVSSMLGVGGGLGLVMSGLIADHGSWRLLFVVGAVIGTAALLAVWRYVPESPVRSPSRPDAVGALLLSGGLIAILVALTEGPTWGWGSVRFLGLCGLGIATLVAWGAAELRIREPMVDMRMLARRPVLFTNLAALATGVVMYVTFTLAPVLSELPRGLPPGLARMVDYGFGASVTVAALYLLPGALAMLPAGPLGGLLGRARGARVQLVTGLGVMAVGSALLAAWHAEPWQLVTAFVVASVGVAVAFGAMPKLITDAVAPTETGVATGMNTVVRTVGGVIGSQIGATLLASQTIGRTAVPAESAFEAAFWLAAALAVVGMALAALAAPRRAADVSALEVVSAR